MTAEGLVFASVGEPRAGGDEPPAPSLGELLPAAASRHSDAVRHRVSEVLSADYLAIRKPLLDTIEASGGPLRGVLLVCVAEALGATAAPAPPAAVLDCAAAMELAALAPECLRSVVDRPATAVAAARNNIALLGADWALSSGLGAATGVGAARIRAFAAVNRELWDAEMLERAARREGDWTTERYVEEVVRRRAGLTAFAAWLGAELAGAPERQSAAARAFAHELAVALETAAPSVAVESARRVELAERHARAAVVLLDDLDAADTTVLRALAALPLARLAAGAP